MFVLRALCFVVCCITFTAVALGFFGDSRALRRPLEHLTFQALKTGVQDDIRAIKKNLLTYRTISFDGAERYSEDDLRRLSGLEASLSVLDRTPSTVAEQLKKIAWVEKADVKTKFFPLRLEVSVLEADPWLVAEFRGETWLVSREGHLLQSLRALSGANVIVETMSLPRLAGVEDADRLREALRQIKLFETAGGFRFQIERYHLLEHGELETTFLEAPTSPEVEAHTASQRMPLKKAVFRIGDQASANDGVSALEAVASDLRRRGEVVEILDLRFKNQAVLTGGDAAGPPPAEQKQAARPR